MVNRRRGKLTSASLHLPQRGTSEQTWLFLEWGSRQTPSLATPYSFTNIYLQPRHSRHRARRSGYKGESVTHSQNTGAGLPTWVTRGQALPSHPPRNRDSSEGRSSHPGQASLAAGLSTQWRLQTCLPSSHAAQNVLEGPHPTEPLFSLSLLFLFQLSQGSDMAQMEIY